MPSVGLTQAIALVAQVAAAACTFPTPRSMQQQYLDSLTPETEVSHATAEARPSVEGELAGMAMTPAVSVRVYVDQDCRAAPNWQERYRRVVEQAGEYLEEHFGTRLSVVQVLPWQRRASLTSLHDALAEVHQKQAAEVPRSLELVVGIVGPMGIVESSLHALGEAPYLARYLVVRAADDSAERATLQAGFPLLTANEIERAYQARRQHKERVVLLHEIGHALGVPHSNDAKSYMWPEHRVEQSGFDSDSAQIVSLGLRWLAQSQSAIAADEKLSAWKRWRDDLHAVLSSAPQHGGPWRTADVQVVQRLLEARDDGSAIGGSADESRESASAATSSSTPTPASSSTSSSSSSSSSSTMSSYASMSAADTAELARALASAADGKTKEAWRMLKPLSRRYDDEVEVQSAACELTAKLRPIDLAAATSSCLAAASLLPNSARPMLLLARAHLDAGNVNTAASLLTELHSAMIRKAAADAHSAADAYSIEESEWRLLSELCTRAHLVTLSQQVTARTRRQTRDDGAD